MKYTNKKYTLNKEIELLEYLITDLKYKRSDAKALLTYKRILVNDKVVTKYNYLLNERDVLEILVRTNNDFNLDIIYEDKNYLVINKPSGLLSISTEKEKDLTAYHLARTYLNNKHEKCFVLHRLDKDTSGVLVFVKNEKLKLALQNNWNDIVKSRKYYAIVKGQLEKKKDTIKNNLKENRAGIIYSTSKDAYTKEAITSYKVIKENEHYSLLDVDIKTGRKNQIRVTLSDLGNPVIGDDKYGQVFSPIKRLGLHAYELEFISPVDHKSYNFKTNIPYSFNSMFKKDA